MKLQPKQLPVLSLPDTQMLVAIGLLKDRGAIRFQQEFMDAIGMKKQNIRGVRKGTHHFTAIQIMKACETFGLNANWIIGQSPDAFIHAKVRSLSLPKAVNARVNTAR